MYQKVELRVLADFKTNLLETPIHQGSFWRVWSFVSLFQKNGLVFVDQIWHSKSLNQYSVTQKIRFRRLGDFKTNLSETSIWGKTFWRVPRFVSLYQKNGFVFVKQIWSSQVLNQNCMVEKIRFRVLTDFKTNSEETPI